MTGVSVRQFQFGPWGNCIELSNGIVHVVATVDFGPRIIRFGFIDGENLFKEDIERQLGKKVSRFSGIEEEWKIYGGHRLWASPEALPRTYYPDNAPVSWKTLEDGVILTPPEEKWTQLQKEIEIRMNASGEVTVEHRITNTGAWPVKLAPWSLTVMAPGGTAIIPQVKRDTDLLGNRVLVLWPYSRMNDNRVSWGEDYILVHQGPGKTPFKLGTNNEQGWAAYYYRNHLFVKYYKHDPNVEYPDFGASFECYVSDDILELETIGELKAVAPQETVIHQEIWDLFQNIEFPLDHEETLGRELQFYLKG